MLVVASHCSEVLKNFKFSTIDVGTFLVVLLLKIAFSIYHTFGVNALRNLMNLLHYNFFFFFFLGFGLPFVLFLTRHLILF